MPLENLGGGKWRWGKHGKIYSGKDAKKKSLKQGYAEDPKHFKEEMGDAKMHYDSETLILAHREIESSQAKIVQVQDGYKILGQGKVFATLDEAILFQYNTGEEVEDGPLVNTKRKANKKNENFFSTVKDAYASDDNYLDTLENAYAYVTKKERDSTSEEDFADPKHKKYPISTKDHLKSAIKLYGRSKDTSPDEVKKNIIKIAKRKGWTSSLPDDWQ